MPPMKRLPLLIMETKTTKKKMTIPTTIKHRATTIPITIPPVTQIRVTPTVAPEAPVVEAHIRVVALDLPILV